MAVSFKSIEFPRLPQFQMQYGSITNFHCSLVKNSSTFHFSGRISIAYFVE